MNSTPQSTQVESPKKSGSRRQAPVRPMNLRELWMMLGFIVIWCGFWLWASAGPPASRQSFDYIFNSMLDHLMHGRFDVDPQIVGVEGYVRNGITYSYFGIWCALLRFPLWIVGRLDIDITAFSCLVAICIAGLAKLRTLLLLWQTGSKTSIARFAVDLFLVYILMGGPEVAYLKASVYQEIVFWVAAFGSVFVYFAIKGLVRHRFTRGTLSWMALSAGLALLTRFSTGFGLMLAFGLLLLVLITMNKKAESERGANIAQWKRALLDRRILVPVAIVGIFVVVTGAVNYFRWGNPTVFADFKLFVGNANWPDRLQREATYGMFNLRRLPFGIMYYFFPVWQLHPGGHFIFEQYQQRWFDDIELPAASFLLSDLLPLCFIAFLVAAFLKRRSVKLPPFKEWAAIAIGLLSPCVMILMAISMAYRYRMEFYPAIDFLAFLGLYAVLTDEGMQAKFARARPGMALALAISIVASMFGLIQYLRTPLGPAIDLLRRGAM